MVGILTRPHRPLAELVPNADAELVQLIESCLEKDRDARVQTAREVSDRLGAIARRLGGPSALGTAQRRATDRLPGGRLGGEDEVASDGARHLFALGVEELKVLSGLRASRSTIGIASALTGIAIGAVVAMFIGGQKTDSPVFVPTPAPHTPLAASSAPPSRAQTGPEATAPSEKARSAADSHDLALAVARGLGLGSKSRR
jgi:hypothetical protein